ncbi:MAG TPA: FHA domain-containing protein [Pirellulales bacterium]|nr:FHA domain-containing protein [Pirellulales bacterium]
MELRLKVLVGKSAGQEVLIPGPKFFIGRAEDCQLRPRSDLISRHHCALLIEESFVAVRDFGSKNGTLVNGERVSGERELKAGDRLTVGPLEFEVCLVTATAAKKRPKVESVREAAARTAEGSEDNLDVSQWLTDKDKDGATETRVINVNETSEIDLKDDRLEDQEAPASASDSDLPVKSASTSPKTPGKLPPAAKAAAGDSGGAAADVLNKFFKRR